MDALTSPPTGRRRSAASTATRCCIRGYDLEELIGGQSFTASCFLLLRGRLPSPGRGAGARRRAQRRARLRPAQAGHGGRPVRRVGQPEHGRRPGDRRPVGRDATRWRRRTRPASSSTPTNGYVGDRCARSRSGRGAIVADARARRQRIPGFGHPRFQRVDPRAQRLKEIAVGEGAVGRAGRAVRARPPGASSSAVGQARHPDQRRRA